VTHRSTSKLTARKSHKQQQLCSQVAQAISLSLGDSTDHRLHDLVVQSVVPAPDGSRLLVIVAPSEAVGLDSLDEILGTLEGAHAWLRRQVAAEIRRKRAPDLVFQVLPSWEAEP
jgi:ribosome-binding factor A